MKTGIVKNERNSGIKGRVIKKKQITLHL